MAEYEIEIEEEAGDEADDGLQAAVSAEIRDAVDYVDTVLSPERAKATKYYKGEPFGTEREGSSAHVSTDVRDTVLGILPPLMRIFAGAERIAEFAPVGPEDIQGAEQATDTVHYVFDKQNPGFLTLYSVFKDALTRKTGVVKWWHEEKVDTNEYEFTGLAEDQVAMLLAEPGTELVEMEGESELDEFGTPIPTVFDITIKRTKKQQKYCVAAVPPEEFIFSREARDLDSSSYVGHRQMKTVSDLVAMGYDYDEVFAASSNDDELNYNEELFRRNEEEVANRDDRQDPASRSVLYIESYIRYDLDGDGINELLKVCTIGNANKVVNVEGADEVPFAVFTPDPEPHTIVGLSEADKVMDIQETKSEVMRDVLDSLAQSIHPRTGIVEGEVNMDDVLNTETGAIIRMRAPGMVQPFSLPFVGQQAFPLLTYLDEVKEARTGVSKASQGLNADALQSSTRAAVAATISSAQGRVELIARVFAETGLKRLFKGLLKLIIKHQDQPMVVRLRGQFVPVDPRVWNADMDVEINVALSASSNEEKLNALSLIIGKQEGILQLMGPSNPLVTFGQYRNSLAKFTELSGFKDVTRYFNELPMDYQPPQQQPKPSPEELLAQAQAQSIQADVAKKGAELQLKREEMLRQDDRERDRIEVDMYLRAAELQAKYGAQINMAQIQGLVDRDREAIKQAAALQQAAMQPAQPQAPMPPGSV